MDISKVVGQCMRAVLNGAYRARKYWSPKYVIKVTRIGRPDKRDRQDSVRVTIGRPNYAERRFVKQCLAAAEPFPVKKVQLKFKAS